jgi:glycosyltransferase involved in cell wall biosynthesis
LAVPGVVFAGMQQPPEMARCYVAADMLALPSWQHETWGLVVNEAMNFGLPVIASDHVGCAADLVLEGRTGAVVPHNDTRRLAETIERMVIDEPGRRAMGRHARELVDRYSIAAAADGIIAACAGEQEVGAWTSRAAIAA